jgi:hypothetical protein
MSGEINLGPDPVTVPAVVEATTDAAKHALLARGVEMQSEGHPAVQKLAVPWAVLSPIMEQIAPSVTHAVLARLAAVVGPKLRPILDKYSAQLRQLMDPADYDMLVSVVNMFIPGTFAAHMDPAARPLFGSAPAE